MEMMGRSGEMKQEKHKNETDLKIEKVLLGRKQKQKNNSPHILSFYPLVYRPSEAAKM